MVKVFENCEENSATRIHRHDTVCIRYTRILVRVFRAQLTKYIFELLKKKTNFHIEKANIIEMYAAESVNISISCELFMMQMMFCFANHLFRQ